MAGQLEFYFMSLPYQIEQIKRGPDVVHQAEPRATDDGEGIEAQFKDGEVRR